MIFRPGAVHPGLLQAWGQVEQLAVWKTIGARGRAALLDRPLQDPGGKIAGESRRAFGQGEQPCRFQLADQLEPAGVIQSRQAGRVFQVQQGQRDGMVSGGAQQVVEPVAPAQRAGMRAVPAA